jgi:hypothetical protein
MHHRAFFHCGLVALAIASACTSAHAAEFQLEPGFTRLDNGANLEGWNGRKEGWSIVDGAIHLTLRAAKSHIYCDQTHSSNCIIRLQFRATPRADSGVFVWGKQFQVRDFASVGPREYAAASRPAGEWNNLELNIVNGIATILLNDQVIEERWPIGEQSKKGLGLQRERGDFDFRFIRLQETK